MKRRITCSLVATALAAMMLQAAPALADPPAHSQGWRNGKGHAGQRHDDDRHYGWRGDYDRDHYDGRYYAPRGYVTSLPPRHREIHYHGDRYYYGDGAWYRPYGSYFTVVAPPIGLVVSFLPEVQATLFFGGVPYYQAGPVYYVWQPQYHGYVVTQRPW